MNLILLHPRGEIQNLPRAYLDKPSIMDPNCFERAKGISDCRVRLPTVTWNPEPRKRLEAAKRFRPDST